MYIKWLAASVWKIDRAHRSGSGLLIGDIGCTDQVMELKLSIKGTLTPGRRASSIHS